MFCGQPIAARPTAQAPIAPQPGYGTSGQMPNPAVTPVTQVLDQQRQRNKTFLIIVAMAAVVAFLVAGGNALRSLMLGAKEPQGRNLQTVARRPPPALTETARRVVMPDDIRDWLEHLHQSEIARVKLTQYQVDEALVDKEKLSVNGGADAVKDALNGIDDPNSQIRSPVDSLAQTLKTMHDQCQKLQDDFDSVPAPDECKPIQAAYDQALGETTAFMGDLSDHLAAGDIDKLQSMKGMSTGDIDAAGAKTDRLVGEICEKYETKKWFTINKDIGTGGMMSVPGF
jgi:hypothetical protein